jgi:hypothetical protein
MFHIVHINQTSGVQQKQMFPSLLNDRVNRRIQLLRGRTVDRAINLVMDKFASHPEQEFVRDCIMAQVNLLQTSEEHILDKDAHFVSDVVGERVKIALDKNNMEKLKLRSMVQKKDAQSFAVGDHSRVHVFSRYQNLQNCLIKMDTDRTGYLDEAEIRKACRHLQLESVNVERVLKLGQTNSYGQISYLSFSDRLKAMDFPDEEFSDGVSRGLPVDEWGTLLKVQGELVNAYEKQNLHEKRAQNIEYQKQLKQQTDEKAHLRQETELQNKAKEREIADRSALLYAEEEELTAKERLHARKREALVRQNMINEKAHRTQVEAKAMKEWAKEAVEETVKKENAEYLKSFRRKQEEREQWKKSIQIAKERKSQRELEKQAQLEMDKMRMQQWEKILEKEDAVRRANLARAVSYKPPPALIQAAEGVTEKAKKDEQRALEIQQKKLLLDVQADEEMAIARRRAEEQIFAERREQAKIRQIRIDAEKARDKEEVDALMSQVKLSLEMEKEEAVQKRKANLQYAQELRNQALNQRLHKQNTEGRMTETERLYNRSLVNQAISPRKAVFSSTASRIFG